MALDKRGYDFKFWNYISGGDTMALGLLSSDFKKSHSRFMES